MRESNAYPIALKTSYWPYIAFALCLASVSLSAAAQQQPASGTVETFETVVDAVAVHRVQTGSYGITELMMAALEGDVGKAHQLIQAGANVNETDDTGQTPLMWAAQSGDINTVKFLIFYGADIRAKSPGGSTAVIYAVSRRYEDIAVLLIDGGADANGWPKYDKSFLESAAESNMLDLVEALIRNGADLGTYGSSALSYAVGYGYHDIAFALLDTGVDVNYKAPRAQHSILHSASGSGNVDLVNRLLSRGAHVDQSSSHSSPLYPAATEGKTEIAELLIDSGATVGTLFIDAAAKKGFADTAVALLHHLDVEVLNRSEIERLLAVAETLGSREFTQLLLSSPPAKKVHDKAIQSAELEILAAKREHSRLLYARQLESYCAIEIWDSRSGDTTELAKFSSCPPTIFVSDDVETVFLEGKAVIQLVSIDNPAEKSNIVLPNLDYRAWIDQMTLRVDRNPDYLPSITQMRPIGVGRFEDGSLGLLVSLGMPADDEYHYLFRHEEGTWSFEDERWCGRWGCENPIDALAFKSSDAWVWPESRRIQHPKIALNPFFSDHSVEMVDLEYESYQAATHHCKFEIDGVPSVVTAYTSPSEHSATDHTFSIELAVDGKPPISLSDNQCLSSVVGRFILVQEFFRGRFEVTDIGNGETVIGDLSAAMWLD